MEYNKLNLGARMRPVKADCSVLSPLTETVGSPGCAGLRRAGACDLDAAGELLPLGRREQQPRPVRVLGVADRDQPTRRHLNAVPAVAAAAAALAPQRGGFQALAAVAAAAAALAPQRGGFHALAAVAAAVTALAPCCAGDACRISGHPASPLVDQAPHRPDAQVSSSDNCVISSMDGPVPRPSAHKWSKTTLYRRTSASSSTNRQPVRCSR